jgi:hypothetical protein
MLFTHEVSPWLIDGDKSYSFLNLLVATIQHFVPIFIFGAQSLLNSRILFLNPEIRRGGKRAAGNIILNFYFQGVFSRQDVL